MRDKLNSYQFFSPLYMTNKLTLLNTKIIWNTITNSSPQILNTQGNIMWSHVKLFYIIAKIKNNFLKSRKPWDLPLIPKPVILSNYNLKNTDLLVTWDFHSHEYLLYQLKKHYHVNYYALGLEKSMRCLSDQSSRN